MTIVLQLQISAFWAQDVQECYPALCFPALVSRQSIFTILLVQMQKSLFLQAVSTCYKMFLCLWFGESETVRTVCSNFITAMHSATSANAYLAVMLVCRNYWTFNSNGYIKQHIEQDHI